jgi:hypothetical protein
MFLSTKMFAIALLCPDLKTGGLFLVLCPLLSSHGSIFLPGTTMAKNVQKDRRTVAHTTGSKTKCKLALKPHQRARNRKHLFAIRELHLHSCLGRSRSLVLSRSWPSSGESMDGGEALRVTCQVKRRQAMRVLLMPSVLKALMLASNMPLN